MEWLRSMGGTVNNSLQHIGGVLLVVCLASSVLDVGNRIFFGASLPWSHEVSIWSVIIFSFLLAGVLVWEKTHINVDLVIKRLKGLAGRVVGLINLIATLLFCGLVAYAGIDHVSRLIHRHYVVTLGVWTLPFWPIILSSIAIGMVIATIYCIVTLIHEL